MTLNINLTRRVRRRKLKDGSVVEQTRYVLNWRDPRTGEREQRFFERQRDAQERRSELIAAYDRGAYSSSNQDRNRRATPSRRGSRRSAVRSGRSRFATYAFQSRYVVGPLAAARGASRDHSFRQRCEAEGQSRSSSSAGRRCRS